LRVAKVANCKYSELAKLRIARFTCKGHKVKALVRNEEKLRNSLEIGHKNHENLQIVKVENIFNPDELKVPLENVDVVMSTLGFGRGSTGYEDVTKAIAKALLTSNNSCRRCVFMHSWYTDPESRSQASFLLRWLLFTFIGPILDNMRKAEQFLESQNEIDYTVILPGGLSSSSATTCEFFAEENSFFVEGKSGMIPRADVARYMIKTVEEDLHHNKIVAIYPKN